MAGFQDVRQDPETGELWVQERGRTTYRPASKAEVDASFESTLGGLANSAVRGIEQVGRGAGQVIANIARPVNELIPGWQYDEEAGQANQVRLDELAAAQEGASQANPITAPIGNFAPDAALAAATLGTGLPATLGGRAGLFVLEGAGMGAARTPDAPLEGALIGGGLGLVGGLGGELVGAGVRSVRGFGRGAVAGRRVADGVPAATTADEAGVLAGATRETGAPGSMTGVDTMEIGQAANKGWGMRMAGFADRAPDEAFNREAAELGFRLTPGVAQGSKALRQVEAALESRPGGAAAFTELREQNEQALNRLMVEALGGEGADLAPQALNGLREGLEGTFEDAGQRIGRVDLKGALREVNDMVEKVEDPTVHRWISPIADRIPMELNGPDLMKRLSKYRRDADNLWSSPGGDRAKAEALDNLADVVEKHMLRQAPREVGDALKDATERWRLLRTVDRSNVINQEGTISPGNLNQALQQRYRNEYRYDRGTGHEKVDRLLKGARVAWRMRDIVGNSGTATRSQGLLEAMTTGQLTRGFGKAYLDGLDLDAAARMAAGAGATGMGGAAVLGGAGNLLGD